MIEIFFLAYQFGEAIGGLLPCGSSYSSSDQTSETTQSFKEGQWVVSKRNGRMLLVWRTDYSGKTFYSGGTLYQQKDFRISTQADRVSWERQRERQRQERDRLYNISVQRGFPLTEAELNAITR